MLKNKNNFEIIHSFFHCLAENFSDHPHTYICYMRQDKFIQAV